MSFKNLKKNIRFLLQKRLKDEFIAVSPLKMDDIIDNLKYELLDDLKTVKRPIIKTVEETIETLQQSKNSICRFGDGELNLMQGIDIPMQTASKELQKRLIEVFKSNNPNIMIAIPRACYYSKENLSDVNKDFWRTQGRKFREIMFQYLGYERIYYAAEMTLAYSYFKNYDCKNYFNQLRKIWDKKDIVIVCGRTVFDKIETNIFDNSESIEYLHVPSINAFNNYSNILASVLEKDQTKPVILICGPTAKILAYDLAQSGRRALDFGHIAKQYDWYLRGNRMDTLEDSNRFFDPD